MSRRPYIEQSAIRNDLHANATHRPNEYTTQCTGAEPVGMDGRNDWFRWWCRECERKHISPRAEKHQKFYRCVECDTPHFIYKGFFNLDRRPTEPLTPEEVTCDLYHAECAETEYGSRSEFYGSLDYIVEKIEGDTFDVERVWMVTEECEVLAQEGDVSAEALEVAVIQ